MKVSKILDPHLHADKSQAPIRGIGLQAQSRGRKAGFRMAKTLFDTLANGTPPLRTVPADTPHMLNVDAMQKP